MFFKNIPKIIRGQVNAGGNVLHGQVGGTDIGLYIGSHLFYNLWFGCYVLPDFLKPGDVLSDDLEELLPDFIYGIVIVGITVIRQLAHGLDAGLFLSILKGSVQCHDIHDHIVDMRFFQQIKISLQLFRRLCLFAGKER